MRASRLSHVLYLDLTLRPKGFSPNWDAAIKASGPIGVFVVALCWNGLVIDKDFRIWRQEEEAIDLLHTPYQSLQPQPLQMAARARTNAAWYHKQQYTTTNPMVNDSHHSSYCVHSFPTISAGLERRNT